MISKVENLQPATEAALPDDDTLDSDPLTLGVGGGVDNTIEC